MFAWWNDISLFVVDGLLGWLLRLPSDLVLIAVALISATVLTVIRRYTTNQELLGRIAHDKKRLRQLQRSSNDREAKRRIGGTRAAVMLKALRAEGWPLLVSLLPIGLLATWCIFRLEYHPPRDDEPVKVVVETPLSKVGMPIHLVPQDDLKADGWVREVRAVEEEGRAVGIAAWTLRGKAATKPYGLLFRLDKRSYGHQLLIGQPSYAEPVDVHSDGVVTYVEMRPVRLAGVVPGIAALAFPPWLVAYLLLTIPCAFLAKRVSGTW